MYSVAIIGSCVTRDACEPDSELSLKFYVARTSFGSAFSELTFPLALEQLDRSQKITSAWQRSMIEIDLNKKLPNMIRALEPGSTLVIDFIDERFSLLHLNGAFATYSAILQPAFDPEKIKEFNRISSSSDVHFEIWKKGFRKFLELAKSRSLRVFVNNCMWASQTTSGAPIGELALVQASNNYLERLYKFAADLNLTFLHSSDQEFIAAGLHRWGPAPFHYCIETTKLIRKAILDTASKI